MARFASFDITKKTALDSINNILFQKLTEKKLIIASKWAKEKSSIIFKKDNTQVAIKLPGIDDPIWLAVKETLPINWDKFATLIELDGTETEWFDKS